MKRSDADILGGFGRALAALGSFGAGACTVALVVALAQSGNVCGALAVGVVASAALVYAGDWIARVATISEIIGRGSDGD